MRTITVAEVCRKLENRFPVELALEWDRVGLQLGNPKQPVTAIAVMLDVTPQSFQYALDMNADMIVSHHPLIFKPLSSITDPLLLELIRRNCSVYCAHTNLDMAPGGVEDCLAAALGLEDITIVTPQGEWLHLAVYVPPDRVDAVASAMFAAGAGRIGKYEHCHTYSPVTGGFIPGSGANPAIGETGRNETVQEIRFECFTDEARLGSVLSAMKKAHPYETPAYAVYPQKEKSPNTGLGRIGRLPEPMTLEGFARAVKHKLGAPSVSLWPGDFPLDSPVSTIATACGSGSSQAFRLAGKADVLVTGDAGYHTMIDSPVPIIDAGHYYTEAPGLQALARVLTEKVENVKVVPGKYHRINKLRRF